MLLFRCEGCGVCFACVWKSFFNPHDQQDLSTMKISMCREKNGGIGVCMTGQCNPTWIAVVSHKYMVHLRFAQCSRSVKEVVHQSVGITVEAAKALAQVGLRRHARGLLSSLGTEKHMRGWDEMGTRVGCKEKKRREANDNRSTQTYQARS